MTSKTLMIQGTASSAGKSLLVTALCRIFARKGLRVAPFKAQNMSLNFAVTMDGHEISRAQAVQAEAAGIEASSFMNPVLLKPTGDRRSQLMVLGKERGHMDAHEYYAYRPQLIPEVCDAFAHLASRYDLIILEGAGSPAEINLREHDIANMGAAAIANAPVVLVGDIDRGGVFASLFGTVKLLEVEEQRRIRGFVINKFRGDSAILEPGLRQLEYMMARPVLGVLPWWDVHIDEEDSLAERLGKRPAAPANGAGPCVDIAVIRLPRLANFTDFAVFDTVPGVSLRYVDHPAHVGEPDLIILPGTKNIVDDLAFLQESGFARRICEAHSKGAQIMGVGGGFYMLGSSVRGPRKTRKADAEQPGLGLLPMRSTLAAQNHSSQSTLLVAQNLPGMLAMCGGMSLPAYATHAEASLIHEATPLGTDAKGRPLGAINAQGTVCGSCLHGLFDTMAFTHGLINALRHKKDLPPLADSGSDYASFREQEYDRLASMVESHMDMDCLWNIITSWS